MALVLDIKGLEMSLSHVDTSYNHKYCLLRELARKYVQSSLSEVKAARLRQ